MLLFVAAIFQMQNSVDVDNHYCARSPMDWRFSSKPISNKNISAINPEDCSNITLYTILVEHLHDWNVIVIVGTQNIINFTRMRYLPWKC